jgi:hypothetical protein
MPMRCLQHRQGRGNRLNTVRTVFMYDSCMATKTITLELDAYEKLRRAKRSPRESFSSVVRRARFDDGPSTGPEVLSYLERLRDLSPESFLSEAALSRIEERAFHRPVRDTIKRSRR